MKHKNSVSASMSQIQTFLWQSLPHGLALAKKNTILKPYGPLRYTALDSTRALLQTVGSSSLELNLTLDVFHVK